MQWYRIVARMLCIRHLGVPVNTLQTQSSDLLPSSLLQVVDQSHLSKPETGDTGVPSTNTGAAHYISCLQNLPLSGLLEGLVFALILAAQLTLLILQLLQLAQVGSVGHVYVPHLQAE